MSNITTYLRAVAYVGLTALAACGEQPAKIAPDRVPKQPDVVLLEDKVADAARLDLSTPEKAALRLIDCAHSNNRSNYMEAILPSERNKPGINDLFENMKLVRSQQIEGITGDKILTIVQTDSATHKCYLSFTEVDGQYFIKSGGPRR